MITALNGMRLYDMPSLVSAKDRHDTAPNAPAPNTVLSRCRCATELRLSDPAEVDNRHADPSAPFDGITSIGHLATQMLCLPAIAIADAAAIDSDAAPPPRRIGHSALLLRLPATADAAAANASDAEDSADDAASPSPPKKRSASRPAHSHSAGVGSTGPARPVATAA
jgi:hypothetical protein